MNQTLKELGEEYLAEIEKINEKIEKYRKRLKKALHENNSDEVYTVQRLLRVFYGQKWEMTDNARILINYYN